MPDCYQNAHMHLVLLGLGGRCKWNRTASMLDVPALHAPWPLVLVIASSSFVLCNTQRGDLHVAKTLSGMPAVHVAGLVSAEAAAVYTLPVSKVTHACGLCL